MKDIVDPNKHAWAEHIRWFNLPSGYKPAPIQNFEIGTGSDWDNNPEDLPTASTAAASRPISPPKYMDKDSDTDSD